MEKVREDESREKVTTPCYKNSADKLNSKFPGYLVAVASQTCTVSLKYSAFLNAL